MIVHAIRLPSTTLELLWQVLDGEIVEVVQHQATVSAAQTQSVLPAGVLVEKTVTVAFGDRNRTCVLWTGVGDFQIKKADVLLVARRCGLGRRAAKDLTINPGWVDPVVAFGMEAGMVSPFLPPRACMHGR